MKINEILSSNPKAAIVAIPILIVLFPLAYSVVCCGFSSPQPFLEKPDEKHEKCVKDTAYMRFHHMDLLKRVRDEVVREGREGEVELDGCRECHPSRERFCNRCHDAVNLTPDCFRCHHYPERSPESRSVALERQER